jgi:hypothetical protein
LISNLFGRNFSPGCSHPESDQPEAKENAMKDPVQVKDSSGQSSEREQEALPDRRRRSDLAIKALVLLFVFTTGSVGGYLVGSKMVHIAPSMVNTAQNADTATANMDQVNPPDGYAIPAMFGDIGPIMVAAGAIDLAKFSSLYESQNKPLTDEQMSILTQSTQYKVVIDPSNAYFLLNFFWAYGLTNKNPILTTGPMVAQGIDKVGGFASTGGWTLGSKSPTKLYASTKITTLTDEQQARLQDVASGVYRPCCNNPTHFPDCNHGMAMLGLLELMASQDASEDEMFRAAKYVTAFWYPQQMLEVATAFKALKNVDYDQADARMVVSGQFASITGYQSVHQWLAQNGLLAQAPSSGGSCGVQ